MRPSGTRRSRWLREALAAEPDALSGFGSPPAGSTTADVVVLGGGCVASGYHLGPE